MMKWMLAAGAAALAIAAPVTAQRGGGDNDRGQAAKVERGGKSQAKAKRSGGDRQRAQQASRSGQDRQHSARTERASGSRQQAARADRRGSEARRYAATQDRGRRAERAQVQQRGSRDAERARPDRGRVQQADRASRRFEVQDNRTRGRTAARIDARDQARGRDANRVAVVDRDGDVIRVRDFDRNRDVIRVRDFDRGVMRVRDIDRDDIFIRRLGYGVGGCPPGLASKGCLPPGQARKLIGVPITTVAGIAPLAPLPLGFRSLYWDDDDYYYRWGGGYLYRVDRGDALVAAMIPLFGAALIGQPLQPAYYANSYVPPYYNAFYPNSPYDCYRYGFGYVYETDCLTGMVEDVIPTYDYGYGVGQLLPASYGYYNLPYQYRGYFADDDDYYYRYAPGAIYRVDRETALITAVAALLTGGLTVGQPLPTGYSAYNVPLAYRTTYYDTPDAWYRYDNGYIYAVDPRTRMVNNVAYVIV
ncbi:MAG TPA: hypothetical protein VFR36_02880 [Sphingomicrobium sp.]|nr:hypothetical protein [Sphingomicrobium sp.]